MNVDLLEAFFASLADSPDDWGWGVRSVFADWCEDNGLPDVAECLRWMVKHRKRPYRTTGQEPVICSYFAWFNADTVDPNLGDPESNIPGVIYGLLPGGSEDFNHKSFVGQRDAEKALQDAWKAARKAGWSPN